MEFEYRGWVIDAGPDFSLGKFFARARMICASSDADVDPEMHIERNLAWFDYEDEAIQLARQRAIEWIDAREGNIASPDIDPSIPALTWSGESSEKSS
jgi:hypothetical protein